ncbi:F-box family protein [Raphanus sativus]|nr:F-box family protein [Raphanus sativus]
MTREALILLDLPWDLVLEILFRVPATSLARLSFTCKRWNALFKDHEFIKKHLDKAAKQCMVLMLSDSKVYSMNVNLNGIHDNVVDPQTLLSLNDLHNPEQIKRYKIFHCYGLLLCTTWDLRLLVLNPCTDQIRWIPYSRYKDHSEFSLGYENNKSCQNYKILRCSWDIIGLEPQVVDCGIYDFESHSIVSKAVSLKGNIYWIANINVEEDLLLSFDFSTEKFSCLSICFLSVVDDFVPTALSVVREERLSLLYSNVSYPPKIEIWMTTTHDMIDQNKLVSWSKFLSLELDENNPQKGLSSVTSFFIDEEKKAAVLCDLEYRNKRYTDMVYIVGEDNRFMKIPVGENRLHLVYPVISNYVPSLVRIQQGGVMTRERKRKNRH